MQYANQKYLSVTTETVIKGIDDIGEVQEAEDLDEDEPS